MCAFVWTASCTQYEQLPELKKTDKHDVDVVIDRIKVRPDVAPAPRPKASRPRCAWARLQGHGRVLALEMDSGAEHLFSSRFACPHCQYALGELEPRLFSFNSPSGACPACDGLGQRDVFDPARVLAFPSLSLAAAPFRAGQAQRAPDGATAKAWPRTTTLTWSSPSRACPHAYNTSCCTARARRPLPSPTGSDGGGAGGRPVVKQHPFEGILPNLERRWRETDAPSVRETLARLRHTQACPVCQGARLRPEARHVLLGEGAQASSIHAVSQRTLADALHRFQQLRLQGAKAEIADKVVREIVLRLHFLNDVGLGYLSLAAVPKP